ncbi:PGAP1-domain-containing protein [Rhizophagus irregularis]|uniref:GPI inositol-deacylase n=2 Tax=Rhizophagus irregularis TaxID=588596 RepID=A0A2N1P0E5_9GLOM|nr:PGAP1-domain-containing protein [Rhizophagus irregularis]
MGFLETEERESLEIKSPRYEVDTSQNEQHQGDRTPSPASSENSALLNNNFPSNIQTLTNSFIRYSSTPRKLSASLSMRNASASLSFSYSMIIIGVLTIILVGMIMDSFFNRQKDSKGCHVSRMYPWFIKHDNFDSEQSKFAGKYGLYLYRDRVYDSNDQPTGIPALFIPGNAGSYKQVRSIASETSIIFSEIVSRDQRSLEMGVRALDFFTVDFNEEFSALHGHSLNEQAEYLNDAIRYILSLYPSTRKILNTNSPHPDPTSVIIVGHSMGGVVARTLFTMPNYQPGSINTILTFATPHVLPPAPFDWQISKIYTDINEFWRNGYSQSATSENSLAEVTLISIAGGNLDTVVCSDSANINSIVPASHGFTVFTTSIPNVWTSMDHQAILWCEQLVKVVATSLLSIVDIRRSGQTKPSAERMAAFRKFYLTGLEDPIDLGLNKSKREFFGIVNLEKVPHKFLNMGQRIVLNHLNLTTQVYLMPIPPPEPLSTFSLLTDQYLSKNPGIEILLCDVMPTEVPDQQNKKDLSLNIDLPTAPRLSCHIASNEASLLPASRRDLKHPFSGLTFNYLKLNVSDLGDYQYIAIMFYNKVSMEGFLIGEFFDERLTIMELNNSSMKDLIIDGIHIDEFPEHQTMVSYLHIPIIDSSLMTYKMSVRRVGCVEHFATFARQSISSMYESKFLVNVDNADLNIHGQSPFVTPVSAPNFRRGLELQFWMDPTCSIPLSIDIEWDFYGSLGKIIMRFQTVLVAFPFIIVIMTLRTQFREYDHGETFISFGHGLALFIRQTFLKFIIFVSALSIYQSVTRASKTYSLADLFPMDYASGDMQKAIKAKSSFNVNDTLLGNQDPFFWFLPPLFFIMSIGITIVSWILLAFIVRVLAGAAVFMSRRDLFVKNIVNKPSESKSRLRRHVIITLILFILVASFVPYQFAFIVAFLVQISSCVKSLIIARSVYKSTCVQESWDNYHYLQSILILFFMLLPFNVPVLMVWIRNMSVNWFAPFSWDHSILAIAPIIFYVEIITNGKMLPRSTGRKSRFVTNAILLIITIYSLLYGVRYTYLLYFSSLGFITWLIILHVRDSWIGKTMDIYMQSIFKRNMKIS